MSEKVSVEVPAALLEEIETELQMAKSQKIQEVINTYRDTSMIVWKASEPIPPRRQSAHPKNGAGKYHGDVATGYDDKREQQPRWVWEQGVIEGFLDDLPPYSWILDCPVGTGRFIPFYEKKDFFVHAVDLSEDMLMQAARKVQKRDGSILFEQNNILTYGIWPNAVDAAVMCRLTRWLSPEECAIAIKNLQRIARDRIIFTIRTEHRVPELARPFHLFPILDGWHIDKCLTMPDDPAYTVVMLKADG